MSRLFTIVVAIAGALAIQVAEAAPTRINTCQVISAPGSYIVNQNLSGVHVLACLEVNADNVTINLAGFELNGAGEAGDGIRVQSGYDNVVIRNGTITNYNSAILYLGKQVGGMISGIRAHGNTAGIIARGVPNMIIKNNLAYDNQLAGIEFGANSIVAGNVIANNGQQTEVVCDSIFSDNVDAGNPGLFWTVTGGTGDCIIADNATDD